MDTKAWQENSQLFDGNFIYIETLYETYLKDPTAVDDHWRAYFDKLIANNPATQDADLSQVRARFLNIKSQGVAQHNNQSGEKLYHLHQMIDAYRRYGHQQARLDPLDLAVRRTVPALSLSYHGFTSADLDQVFDPGFYIDSANNTLRDIYAALNTIYCGTIGIEYMHMENSEERLWLQQRFETMQSKTLRSKEQKINLYQQLVRAEGLEKYLGAKYVGQKRFSLEGGATLIPMINQLVQQSGAAGVKEIIIGMAHRGRLNVLINVMGKSSEQLFKEFEGKYADNLVYSGDVKYHMGFSSDVKTAGGVIHLALTFNPSHLEIIDPVVEGAVRARQDRRQDLEHIEVMPLAIHGDAAFCGQGVVMETLALSRTRGFSTGGTVHMVVNNQIGFTISNPLDSRSSEYCTDIAKMIEAPIFHVNGDDPESCLWVTEVALQYRMQFKKDVIIDLVCYRRHGHNEADEPTMTQPLMYGKIKEHPPIAELYGKQLVNEQVLTEQETKQAYEQYRDRLDQGQNIVELVPKVERLATLPNWKPYKDHEWDMDIDLSIGKDDLMQLSQQLGKLPEGFTPHAQVEKELELRRKMGLGEVVFNWGGAEILAYASILAAGHPVRISGQDAGRGTFSHRHAVLHDARTGQTFIPLQNLVPHQATFTIVDSLLSEEAVVGFEYGYASTDPETLVIWEAQFGDFANGAQVVIDQFISSGEQKWGRLCGLTMLLPHGYEGQGPEHTSARLERYLELCAQANIQVCVPTTPAQMFHLLRRQILRPYRKPLIVMTPKSLLRSKLAISTLVDLAEGEFQTVIPEVDPINPQSVERIILCSGKVYYDLLQARRATGKESMVILRVEQLYPFPKEQLKAALSLYPHAKEIVWCQEEPRNQGAWYSTQHRIQACLKPGQELHYAGRSPSASPAVGYASVHGKEQAALVQQALGSMQK